MATLNLLGGAVTWIDLWKTIDPSGGLAQIYNETLETNNIFTHSVWMPANQGATHQGVRVASLPVSSGKRMGIGTAPTSGSHVNFVEETRVRELWVEIEDEVLNKHPDPEGYLNEQMMLSIQAISQDVVQDALYGNRSTDPDNINGLLVRYGSIQTDRKQGRVMSAGGSSNANSSIIALKWGGDGVFMIYPKDHPTAGLTKELFPAENITDSSNRIKRVRRMRVQFAFGIVVNNRRNFFRLANIDASISAANWALNVENNLITLFNDAPNDAMGFRMYVNNFVKTQFDIRAKDKTNVYYNPMGNYIGQPPGQTALFNGLPMYKTERLIAAEANVT